MPFAASPIDACDGADALVIVTEWKEFRGQDFDTLRAKLQRAAAVRRPQPVRPGAGARRGPRVFLDRPTLSAADLAMSSATAKFSAWRDRVAAARVLVVGDVDARSLLVRRRRAHIARGAGAGGEDHAHGGTTRRCRQRGAQRRRARRDARRC